MTAALTTVTEPRSTCRRAFGDAASVLGVPSGPIGVHANS